MQLPVPGQTFQERYLIQDILGRGGFATVYRAVEVVIGRTVALKVLAPRDDGYVSVASRFMREARVIGGFQDPHTITMFDFGRTDDGLLYMVFEFVDGADLGELIRERGALDEPTGIHVLQQVLYALREAHHAGVLHRDIKPANVLVYEYMGDPYRVKLLDFGIAKSVANEGAGLTREGSMVGTPRYMSPEQVAGETLAASSDLYSLGLLAAEILTGRRVIEGSTTKQIVQQQLADTPLSMARDGRVSEGLCRVVERMLERNPIARYQSAEEVLEALQRLEHQAPAPAPSAVSTTPSPASLPAGHTTVDEGEDESDEISLTTILAAGGVAALLVVLALTGASFLMKDTAPPARKGPIVLPVQKAPVVAPAPPKQVAAAADVADGADVAVDSPDLGTPDMSPRSPRSRGCGEHPLWVGETILSTEFDLSSRTWFAYLPKDYDPDHAYPVVAVFHETLKDGRQVSHDLQLPRLADKKGFIVIAPNQVNSIEAWPRRDAELAKKIYRELSAMTCVDLDHFYVIGSGVGTKMARELPCHMPVSAVAIATAGIPADEHVCVPEPAVPVIRLQGDGDPYAPLKGGINCMERDYLSLKQIEGHWKKTHHCVGQRKKASRHKRGHCDTWTCDVPFTSCLMKGGHLWQNEEERALEFPQCRAKRLNFPYQKEIWGFFQKHGRSLGED